MTVRGPNRELTSAEIAANLRAAAAQHPKTKAGAALAAAADVAEAEAAQEALDLNAPPVATCEGYLPPGDSPSAPPPPSTIEGPVGAAYARILGVQGNWRLLIFDAQGQELATYLHGSRGQARAKATAMGLEVRP